MAKKPRRTHLVIPDAQLKPGVEATHLRACSNLIEARRPEVIINIGDFWDMPSLSAYDAPGSKKTEGRRVQADIDSGNKAMEILLSAWHGKKGYTPEMHFFLGNHENRIERAIEANPKFEGTLGYHQLNLDKWKVHDFLKPHVIDGIAYCHYFYSPMSGKPIGGDARAMLGKIGFSFVQGHRQELSYARKELANGRTLHGLVAGAFHMHDEEYKGHQAADHWRGVCLLHEVHNGEYDLEIIGLDRLIAEYGSSK